MKRILLHLAVSILAFGLGVTVSAVWRFYTSVNIPTPFPDLIADSFSPGLVSEEVGIACGPNSARISHYYYLSNGGEITRFCQDFSSAAEADHVFQARRQAASDIVEWSVNINREGQPVGETVLILESSTAVRLSTSLGTLCETRASSVNDLRSFEKLEPDFVVIPVD